MCKPGTHVVTCGKRQTSFRFRLPRNLRLRGRLRARGAYRADRSRRRPKYVRSNNRGCLRVRISRGSALRSAAFSSGVISPLTVESDACGLRTAHHGDARVRPHPELARRVGAAAHAVVSGAETAADHHREFRHVRARDGHHEFRAVFRDAAILVFFSDHEARDVLQEHERRIALRAEFDEVRALERALAERGCRCSR